jgi:L-fuconolactonase
VHDTLDVKIDSHHHFWSYDPVAYGWIDDAMKVLRQDFLPTQLRAEMIASGVDGVVSVQARQSSAETEWLLQLAAQHSFIRGVVGWVDLRSPTAATELERFAGNRKLKSVRHVVQDEPDADFLLRKDFNRGIGELHRFSLAYDILIFERQLPQTIRFVDAHPYQVFVLDHLGKPKVKAGVFEPWNQNLRELARRPNVYCKVSGLVTEADYTSWTAAQLEPYWETALEAFGPKRLMFGSDWPVCNVAGGYGSWHRLVTGWVSKLSQEEQVSVFGGTAREAYRL